MVLRKYSSLSSCPEGPQKVFFCFVFVSCFSFFLFLSFFQVCVCRYSSLVNVLSLCLNVNLPQTKIYTIYLQEWVCHCSAITWSPTELPQLLLHGQNCHFIPLWWLQCERGGERGGEWARGAGSEIKSLQQTVKRSVLTQSRERAALPQDYILKWLNSICSRFTCLPTQPHSKTR